MAHLYKFRQGWQSENLARFLLSEFAFISQPSTVADDVGSDFYCTLFKKEKTGSDHHLIPKNSFVIQIKSSDDEIDLSSKAGFLEQLELPFFVGVVNRQDLTLKIYSGRALHLLFTMRGIPNKLVAKPVSEIRDKHYFEILDDEQKHYRPFFPLIAEVSAQNIDKDSERVFPIMATECSMIHQNISSRRMGEFILVFGLDDSRIFAGPGSARQFRRNFCLRMAEVFYNFEWILKSIPGQFSKSEFTAYEKSWAQIRPHCSEADQSLVDNIHKRLIDEISKTNS